MAGHKHDWREFSRLAGDKMMETCECGEARTRDMTEDEAADYAAFREEMARLDREGDARVE